MFVGITNAPRDYAWGSRTAIPEFLGTPPSGGPEAELWLGAHPGSPARLADGSGDLRTVLDDRLPFLLKVLAAASPLSLQAHPTPAQAEEGFAREEASGVPIDAPNRSYKDPFHKPELLVAVSDTFDALCGFRPVAEILASLARLPASAGLEDLRGRLTGDGSLPAVFKWLITRGEGVEELVAELPRRAAGVEGLEFETVRRLAAGFPGDPGIVISLLLNTVRLSRGEALYLPAGNIHAYLEGLGIELMAASDNVLRGGLTAKHVDVPELLKVLDFTPRPIPYLEPEVTSSGVRIFRPDVPDFALAEVMVDGGGEARVPLPGPAIALCTGGAVHVSGGHADRALVRSEACYISPDEGELTIAGSGTVFVATTNA
ncbi:mannose-6-phosphate isomerase, class I [Lysobacter korlensis]|uniref:mannose-6-phosphate isomerase n=1 Tax=Lysobacter korlensis TaxID=553636 RepID=A0ABV6S033_9GAMM